MLQTFTRILAIILCSTALLPACRSTAVFYSPNQLSQVPGTIYLSNGDSASGLVSLNTEVLFTKDIQVKNAGGGTQQLHLLDVHRMQLGEKTYELKHKRNHFRPSSGFYFMERLTPPDARLHLYTHMERRQKGKSLQEFEYVPVYHLQLPGEKQDRVWASDSKKLVPHFEKKMSRVLRDCPALADSIYAKRKGLFYHRFSESEAERGRVLMRIANAYNACF